MVPGEFEVRRTSVATEVGRGTETASHEASDINLAAPADPAPGALRSPGMMGRLRHAFHALVSG